MPLLLCVYFWDGFGLVCFFFVRFVRIFFGFVVGFVIFLIWPSSVQRNIFFMPGICKLPATSEYMLQLLHILH